MEKFTLSTQYLTFAKEFSQKYNILPPGTYKSNNESYVILYRPKIDDNYCLGRINKNKPLIELDHSLLQDKKYTPDFVFFLLCMLMIRKYTETFVEADTLALKECLKRKFNRKKILTGFIKMLEKTTVNDAKLRIIHLYKK